MKLINKDALVAEIERRIKVLNEKLIKHPISSPTLEKLIEENKKVLSFLDILEVKEMDSTDAFIEKTIKFFAPHIQDNSGGYDRANIIENFRNYIKGE